jgi:hypothetical protein
MAEMWVKRTQVFLLIGMAVAALRLVYVVYERHEAAKPAPVATNAAIDPDYMVFLRSSHVIDIAGARRMIGQTVWVRNGYIYPAYEVTAGKIGRRTGVLSPLLPLQIRQVVVQKVGRQPGIFFACDSPDGPRAVQIGALDATGTPDFQLDSMFFFDDPHQLYSHWPKDVWQSIDQHQAKAGMSQLQVEYALGVGKVESGEEGDSTMLFPRDGNAVEVTFSGGKATAVNPIKVK